MDNFAAMQETCKKNIYKNTSFYQNSEDGELKLDTTFIASLCPSDCSGHGSCSNATCTCDEFYTAADCSISLKDRPYISAIRKNGLCDVRTRPCGNVRIYGFPFLNSKNLTCHVQEYKVRFGSTIHVYWRCYSIGSYDFTKCTSASFSTGYCSYHEVLYRYNTFSLQHSKAYW